MTELQITFSDKPDVGSLEGFTEADIQRLLAVLPKTKMAYGEKAKQALQDYENAKSNSKQKRAVKHMEAMKQKEKLSNATDRKQWVESQDEVIQTDIKEIQAKADYEMANIEYEYCDDLFTAVRKAANLIEKDQQMQRQAAKYGREE